MINLFFKFSVGFVIGSIAIFFIIYGAGVALESFDVVLYESESDQQRNFNISIFIWLIFSSVTGYLSAKFWSKSNKIN